MLLQCCIANSYLLQTRHIKQLVQPSIPILLTMSKRLTSSERQIDREIESESATADPKKPRLLDPTATATAGEETEAEPLQPLHPHAHHPRPFVAPQHFHASRARMMTRRHSSRRVPGAGEELLLSGDCVVLWMSRDQRVHDNYSLYYAQSAAKALEVPLVVVFNLVPKFLQATLRQYGFMLKGLKEVENNLRALHIPFHLLLGDPLQNLPKFVESRNAAMLVADFSPLRVGAGWVSGVANLLDNQIKKIPFVQVDAHNIVPCWVASPKLEYSARTFRGKITPKIPEFLQDIPDPQCNPTGSLAGCIEVDWQSALDSLEINREVGEVNWIEPGEAAAARALSLFINSGLSKYENDRNNPNIRSASSNLSPYLHFGQISAQKVALTIKRAKGRGSPDSFIEELVVRRELTDNFCYYNHKYDTIEGCYDWAKETLNQHKSDPRPYLYSRESFERGETHDDLWNAAQIQLLREGKMHGFLRMYWAKKILEWTVSPEEALETAIYLNDKYQLDGRDPNGYVGCMWSIGGIHDQGWAERPIFGKIRFMNYKGCQRKFDVKAFVALYPPAAKNAAAAEKLRKL